MDTGGVRNTVAIYKWTTKVTLKANCEAMLYKNPRFNPRPHCFIKIEDIIFPALKFFEEHLSSTYNI